MEQEEDWLALSLGDWEEERKLSLLELEEGDEEGDEEENEELGAEPGSIEFKNSFVLGIAEIFEIWIDFFYFFLVVCLFSKLMIAA